MTKAECGRLGGQSTLRKHGPEHFSRMATIRAARYGHEYMAEIGHRGGERYVELYISRPSYWDIPRGEEVRR